MNILTGRHWDLLAGELELDTKPGVWLENSGLFGKGHCDASTLELVGL